LLRRVHSRSRYGYCKRRIESQPLPKGQISSGHDAASGQTTIHCTFDAFGQLVSASQFDQDISPELYEATADELFAFTGRALDTSTGLQDNLNRWYDAQLGRWLNQDPLGFPAGDTNLYRYAGNSSTIVGDPSGLQQPDRPIEDPYDAMMRGYISPEEMHRLVWQPREKLMAVVDPRVAFVNHAAEMGRLSAGAYSEEAAKRCQGWSVVGTWEDEKDGFRAVLFRHRKTGRYVLALAGTQDLNDWIANLRQGLGFVASQYEKAIALARRIMNEVGRENLELTGHSLGGGLAAAAALVNKLKATTFNPAGVHLNTVARHGENLDEAWRLITVFRVEGDILTTLQDNNSNPIGWIMPDTNGIVYTTPARAGSAFARHKMEYLLPYLERYEYHPPQP